MKKFSPIILTIFLLTFRLSSFSQTCLPEGYLFGSQASIDNFQYDYPGCVAIEGSVTIWNSDVTNLNGLNMLTSFGQDLQIGLVFMNGTALTDLSGLENVSYIGGSLILYENDNLTSLTGLENLTTIGENLFINYNFSLTDCAIESVCNYIENPNGLVSIEYNAPGCDNLEEVEEACSSCLPNGITFTDQSQLSGFQNYYPDCTEIDGSVIINGQSSITNLSGLSNIKSIGGDLEIYQNYYMGTLEGLENLETVGGDFYFNNNLSIDTLDYLNSLHYIGGDITITFNQNLVSLKGLEGLTTLYGDLFVNNHAEHFEGFQNISISYGNIIIDGCLDLQDLTDFAILDSVMGDLQIDLCHSLLNLEGLENLKYVGGKLDVSMNDNLITYDGLQGLDKIGGNLRIYSNEILEHVDGLSNLEEISGDLMIKYNDNLISIYGLEYIDPNSILNLTIFDNPILNECDIESICAYLSDPNGTVTINGNGIECFTHGVINYHCLTAEKENSDPKEDITLHPNPARYSISIVCPESTIIQKVKIYNQTGNKVYQSETQNKTIDISDFEAGLYFVEIVTEKEIARKKLIIK